jgi:Pyridine nucleotide-disulphide oxidoreductase
MMLYLTNYPLGCDVVCRLDDALTRKTNGNYSPDTHLALDADRAAVKLDKLLYQRQAKSGSQVFTNTGLLELDELPRHLVVVGGSYVGLKFVQIYRRFGAQLTVVEMGPRLIQREDPDVSIGGMLTSTVVAIFFVPVFCSSLMGAGSAMNNWFRPMV